MNLHRISRAAAVAVLAAALVLAGSTTAQAATSPVTPLSVLPSQIVKGTATTSTAAGEAAAIRMAQVYKFLTSPATVAALKSQSAGTATKTETDLIADAARKARIPVGVGTLVKGAGAAGAAYGGYQLGSQIGATASGAITSELWGLDANKLVCSQSTGAAGAFLSFFAGQDCSQFGAQPEFTPNTDAKGGYSLTYTGPDGEVVTYVGTGIGQNPSNGRYEWAYCFTRSGNNTGAAQAYSNLTIGANTYFASFGIGQSKGPCGVGQVMAGSGGHSDQASAAAEQAMYGRLLCVGPAGIANCSDRRAETGGETPSNPDRTISCDILGTDGQRYTATGGAYKETEKDWSAAVPKCPGLPAEVLPVTTSLVMHVVGGNDVTLWTQDTPPEVVQGLQGDYKTCLTTVCQLILEKNGVSCFDGADCTGWFADSQTEAGAKTYTCRYAGKGVALSECNVYKPSWEPDAIVSGNVLADPVTGTPAPNSTNPKEAAAAPVKGSGKLDPEVSDDRVSCLPNGFTLNPIDWVLAPLKCAFSPRASVVKALQTKVTTTAAATPAGQLSAAVSTWQLDTPTGCDGFTIDVFFLGPPFQLASACPGTMLAPIAKWSNVFCLIGASVAGFLSVRGSIAGVASYRGGDE